MLQYAEMIIEAFERDAPIPTSFADWQDESVKIAMYLAALKYKEAHG